MALWTGSRQFKVLHPSSKKLNLVTKIGENRWIFCCGLTELLAADLSKSQITSAKELRKFKKYPILKVGVLHEIYYIQV